MVAMTDTPEDLSQPAWAKLLQEQRESRGYSARKAAGIAGVSDSFWGMAERGWKPVKDKPHRPMKPSRPVLIRMTEALRCAPLKANAILGAAGYKPLRGIGEPPDPHTEVDLTGLNRRDVDLLNVISHHLRDNKRTSVQRSLRSESTLRPRTASRRGESK